MRTLLILLLATLVDLLRSRASLQLEMLALRQQLAMDTSRDGKRLRFRQSERIFWVWLYRLWPACLQTLAIFKPDTLVRWHRQGFRLYRTWRSHRWRGAVGRGLLRCGVRVAFSRTVGLTSSSWVCINRKTRFLLIGRPSANRRCAQIHR